MNLCMHELNSFHISYFVIQVHDLAVCLTGGRKGLFVQRGQKWIRNSEA